MKVFEAIPEVIETEKQYREITARLAELISKGRTRTREETKLMHLLGVLVEHYDRQKALTPEESTPAERLRLLLEHSGKTPADLIPVFRQRSHVHEALNGKRKISAGQARKLAKIFSVNPGVFL